MSVPAVLIRLSTGEVIKHAPYPKNEITPVEGLDPDLKWLIKYIPFAQPEYDSRIFKLITTEEITEVAHPLYPELDQYLITYGTEKRVNDEIEEYIANSETFANESLLPYDKRVKLLTLAIGVLIRKSNGITLTAKEVAIETQMIDLAVKVWKNDQALKDKILQLTNGEEPNIDEGWESVQ